MPVREHHGEEISAVWNEVTPVLDHGLNEPLPATACGPDIASLIRATPSGDANIAQAVRPQAPIIDAPLPFVRQAPNIMRRSADSRACSISHAIGPPVHSLRPDPTPKSASAPGHPAARE